VAKLNQQEIGKPIGDVRYKGGIELEVTLAPGEGIRRVEET